MKSKSHKFLHCALVSVFLLLSVTHIGMISLARSFQRSKNYDIIRY
jgi:hypothetical protein